MLQPVLDKNRSSQGKQAVTEALFEAINNANVTKVAEFLNAYPRLNEDKDQMGRTPIQALTEAPVWVWQENDRPRQEIYHLLVQSGADPTVVSAIVSGDVDGIRGFLDRDAPFIHMPLETHGGKHLPLSLAAMFNSPAVMEQLIMAGADVHADYEAALIEAAWSNSVKAAEMLFQHGAQINPSSRESHPLHHACYDISPKTAIFLLNNNADPHALGRVGRVEGSPLMMALKTYNRWDGE